MCLDWFLVDVLLDLGVAETPKRVFGLLVARSSRGETQAET